MGRDLTTQRREFEFQKVNSPPGLMLISAYFHSFQFDFQAIMVCIKSFSIVDASKIIDKRW